MHTLHLTAIDSRYATDEETSAAGVTTDDLPPGFTLMAHQAKTITALRDGNAPIVINTAATGDGKSFAGQFLILNGQRRGMTLYPTNALATDQDRSLHSLKETWTTGGIQDMRWQTISAAVLDELQETMIHHRRPEVLNLLLEKDLVLTNPDIFHLMMMLRYPTPGAAADFLMKTITHRFNLFTFDEFHIFQTPQVTAALIMMLVLLETTDNPRKNPLRFLFLSATPQPMLKHLAALAGLAVIEINGDYEHGKTHASNDRRRILQPAMLHLYERGDGLEAWITANLDRIIEFFQNHPNARGVILVNGIATAFRVNELLKDACNQAGIVLGHPNTGLTSPKSREIDPRWQLFVATSTVDVGVDFKINFLVFESVDHATHMQRLGRLGRHTHNQQGGDFGGVFEAHALLPDWVIKSVQAEMPDHSTVDRERYDTTVKNVYSEVQAFAHYRDRWAGYQAGRVLTKMSSKEIKKTYQHTRTALTTHFQKLFPRRQLYGSTIEEMIDNLPVVFEEATSFRGSSPFSVLVLSKSGDEEETILSYNLIPLLREGILETLDLDEAYKRAGSRAEALRKTNPLIAYRLRGWLKTKPRRLSIILNEPTREWSDEFFEAVIECEHFRLHVEAGDLPDMLTLNDALETRTLVAFLKRNATPDELRVRYRLGLSLEMFPFRSQDGYSTGCAAFGRDALLLDSVTYRGKTRSNHDPMFS